MPEMHQVVLHGDIVILCENSHRKSTGAIRGIHSHSILPKLGFAWHRVRPQILQNCVKILPKAKPEMHQLIFYTDAA